jgi:hypothetical protein
MRVMKLLILFLCLLGMALPTHVAAWDISAELSSEGRLFFQDGAYGNTDHSELSLFGNIEGSHSWDDDRKVLSLIPFFRLSHPDTKRIHFDIREASFVGSWSKLELRVGISKVYWGVTESQHLVDIINQTDLVENIDGEDKLGQPMINPTLVTNFGNFSYFFLPYFRERTFPGANGRFRGPLVIDTDNPIFTKGKFQRHLQHAFRYSHSLGGLEFGTFYFYGTDREPIATVSGTTIRPTYVPAHQVGVDAQYIFNSWAFKAEGIWRNRQGLDTFIATTAGLEYTFGNVYKGLDIGVLAEYLYDQRGNNGEAFFTNHIFSGARFSFNDTLGTEILAGFTFDNKNADFQTIRVEASRRINNRWKWGLEVNAVLQTSPNQVIFNFRKDSYVQGTISYFF